MNFYRFSIPLKLFILLLPMVSLPIAIVGYWAHQTSVNSVTQLSKEHQLSQAHEAASQIDSIFQTSIYTLGIVSQVVADFSNAFSKESNLLDSLDKSTKSTILLHHILKTSPHYLQISILDKQGDKLLGVTQENIATLSSRSHFEMYQKIFSPTFDKPVYISQIKKNRATPHYYIQLAKPIIDKSHNYIGTIVLDLDFTDIIGVVRNIKIGEQGYGFLVDKNGRTIAHPRYNPYEYDLTRYNDPRLREFVVHMLSGETGWMTFNELGEKAAAFAPVSTTGWSMAVSIPIEEFKYVANAHKQKVIQVVLVMIFLSTLVVIYISFRINRPMRSLVFATKQVAAGDLSMEIPVRSKDELGLLSESFNTMIRSLRDIQKELVASEKLISLGRLSAGVAHEIRNPLNAMKGAITYLQRRRPQDSVLMEYSGIISEEVDRLNQFVSDFLLYAKQSEPKKTSTDINELLQNVIILLQTEFANKTIRINFEPDSSLPLISVDQRQLQQVFLNVFINSMAAMGECGTLTVRTEVQSKEEDSTLTLTIHDDGTGILQKDLPYVFDPFFSTKDTGTGLGLPISLSIVENHGGKFYIDANNNKGTTVTIELLI